MDYQTNIISILCADYSYGQSFSIVPMASVDKATDIHNEREIAIPDGDSEIEDRRFYEYKKLRSVTFGPSPSLTRIGVQAFSLSGLREISVPGAVEELGEKCFCECRKLSRVTIAESSRLSEIGNEAFSFTDLREIVLPGCVQSLGDKCFYECKNLSRVKFGGPWCLQQEASDLIGFPFIGPYEFGTEAFSCSGLTEIAVPPSVKKIPEKCFYSCKKLACVTFSEHPN